METCSVGGCLPAGSGRCMDLFPCQADCAAWDLACVDRCEPLLDDASNELAASYLACLLSQCVDCPVGEEGIECVDACVLTQCAEPFVECAAQDGTTQCKEMYACVFACEPSDRDCLDGCYFSATPPHLLYGLELELCVAEYCDSIPPEPEAWPCWEMAIMGPCSDPFFSCIQGECDDSCEGIDCGLSDCLIPCGPPC